jgi:DNA-binding XRE family transcriptional regulator
MAFRAGKCLLRLRLDQAGINQSELGRRVNLSPQMISHYIYNRKIMSLEIAKSIAAALNCNIEDLYVWEHRDRLE